MTNIDIERLKVDREYWDEVAPSWAKSLLGPCHQRRHYWFDKVVDKGDALCIETGYYRAVDTIQPHAWDVIPRPPKKAQEWDGEGLPSVGWHGECTWGKKVNWFECVMLPRYCLALYKRGGWSFMDIFPEAGHEFRPLKSKQERQREELCAIASKYSDLGRVIVDDILSKYNLEPKP